MPGRLVEYLQRVYRKKRYGHLKDPYQVAGALIVLTGKQRPLECRMQLPGTDLMFGWTLGVMNVSREDAGKTLERIGSGLLGKGILPWVPLMSGAEEPAVAEEWARLALAEPDEEKRRDYGGLAQVFARHVGRAVIWDRVLERWQMSDSPVVQGWMNKGEARRLKTTLSRTLQLRFNIAHVPDDLVERIEKTDSLATLERWFDAAMMSQSLDAFRVAILTGNGSK